MAIELPLQPAHASREPRCDKHPTEDAARCRACRSEWIAAPAHADIAMGATGIASRSEIELARRRDIARTRWDALVPPEFADAFLSDFPDIPEVTALVDHFEAYGDPPLWLRVIGPVGTGKTRLLYAVLRRIISGTRPVEWTATTALSMYRALRPSAPTPDLSLYKLQTTPLLLIDDLGAGKYSEWVEDITLELLDERYTRRLPTMISSNLNTKDLGAVVGERVASRLRQRCLRVVLDGPDRRTAPSIEGLAA
jgi:DNA replication protein DnaC